ncbi:MAG: hypothetical protein RLY30_1410 [Pseudomonadota bacterium]|jgi:sulfonate transport system ATP-binding protein
MSTPLLDLSVLTKTYGSQRVIDHVAFQMKAGEVVSLVGPSGCGKSTLLRIVAGLDTQYSGQVRILGEAPQLHSRHVGCVFQEPRLLPWLTVAENVGFDLGREGARHPRARSLLDEVGLADCADAYPKQLSGGMAQRVAIARGLFTQPSLLLLDEPFSAVDAFTRMRLQDLLISVAAHHGTTLLLVTHDVKESVYLSDRIVVMGARPGRINGEVDVPLARPRDRRDSSLSRLEGEVLDLLNHPLCDTPGQPSSLALSI